MAVRLVDLYPGRVEPASEFYPHGSFRNRSSPESNDGSPLDRQWGNDVIGFLQALLKEANIAPSGTPDRVGASQYLDALKKVFPVKTSLSDAATTSVASIRNGLIPKGTSTVFYQPSAPTGWTQVTNINDRVLRVVSGAGGGSGGDWKITGLSASVTVAGHALTIAQIPPHSHATDSYNQDGTAGVRSSSLSNYAGQKTTSTVGGGQPHSHGASASVNQNGDWRPAYIDVIVCMRD